MLSFTRRVVAASLAVAVAMFATSCSSPKGSSHPSADAGEPVISGEPAAFSTDDVSFTNNVIPCQQQALDLDQMATEAHSDSAQLAGFASKDASPLRVDMQILKALRAQWHGGQDESGSNEAANEAHGAIDDATIVTLDSLRGKAFNALWLKSMITLDNAIVTLSNAEISTGKNVDAVDTAKKITKSMSADIGQLQQMQKG